MQLDGQFANERFTQENDEDETEVGLPLNDPLDALLRCHWNAQECEECGHLNARHDTVKGYCLAERSGEIDGIEISGICGCTCAR